MFSRVALRQASRFALRRSFSTEAAAAVSSGPPTKVKLNFSLPHETIYSAASVNQVILPGTEGEYGVTAGHVPYVAQLKPGVVQILHEDGVEPEKWFVCGGYALTHADSSTYVACPEAVKLDDIDQSAVSSQYEKAKSDFAAAADGSFEKAEAQITMEVSRTMGIAIGMNMA